MDAKKDKDNKDATTKRRGALEVSRAISLDPYWGDIVFGSKGGEKGKTSIHNTEVHFTAKEGLEAIDDVIRTIESWDTTTVRASVGQYLVS
ncbi:MAG: hypothetical protein ACKPFK_23375, partial [Dolichospermum sp.]